MPIKATSSFEPLDQWFSSDAQFNQLYPQGIEALAQRHWTPLQVAWKAAQFLATEKDAKILDIGSGVGKFCLVGAYYRPEAFYYGVEQRKNMIGHAERAKDLLQLGNVSFIHGNFTSLDLRQFNHFYFYNSFFENLADASTTIDNNIVYSGELFDYYNRYLYKQLEQTPFGTKLATFHSLEDEVPSCFKVVDADLEGELKFWMKA